MKCLLNRNVPLALICSLALLLPACADSAASADDGLAAAVSEGIIIMPDTKGTDVSDYPMAAVKRGDIERYSDLSIRPEGAFHRDLRFERDEGRLRALNVSMWQEVKEGDVLAEIVFDGEALETDRRQLLLRIEQFENQYNNEVMSWMNRLEDAKAFTHDTDESLWELHQLSYKKLELEYERFLYQRELSRLDFAEQLEAIDERLEGEQLLAPFDGVISYIFNVRLEGTVRSWQRVVTIIDHSRVFFTMTAPKDVVRYGDVFPVVDRSGDIRFDVRVISDPVSPLQPEGAYNFWLKPENPEQFIALMAEHEVEAISLGGMSLSASPLSMTARNVLIIPRRAVQPEDRKNFVWVFEDETLKKRYVKTGLAYADEIQIITGLDEGQLVVLMS
jgi:multidrug efflux pump subunit AcrA (membrane-fusion protein)